jgi:hypothetical protein
VLSRSIGRHVRVERESRSKNSESGCAVLIIACLINR